jgi:hypothetical protein
VFGLQRIRQRIERRDGYRLWEGGPVPRGADGITFGSLVIVREGHAESALLLRHEQVHVRQWRRYGFVGFSARYVGSYLWWRLHGKDHHGAYLRIPLEIEASWISRRSLATAVTDELSATDGSGGRGGGTVTAR